MIKMKNWLLKEMFLSQTCLMILKLIEKINYDKKINEIISDGKTYFNIKRI